MGKRSKKNFFTTILAPNCDEDFILASWKQKFCIDKQV
jgi:hypothetical protein